MGLIIHPEKIGAKEAQLLIDTCPFGAISYEDGKLDISAGCKLCKMCVKKGPEGAITFEEEPKAASVNKDEWKGIAVYAEMLSGKIHPVVPELIGKAFELAKVTNHPVYALLIGDKTSEAEEELLSFGVNKVFTYSDPALKDFVIGPYANAFTDFIDKIKPSSILVGATLVGRSLAPKVAARVHTGLTADCTMLEMCENTDLVQIRPAFGGNIMAEIVTPNTRPQFCTVRYKIFSKPENPERNGEVVRMNLTSEILQSRTEVINKVAKETEVDISDADTIVAVGRGLKSKEDIAMAQELADAIGAKLACTRPLVEAGWFDAKRQIGLSGRTVKPKLIIAIGISGAVQFAAGMRSSEKIIAINSDPNASIFDIAHECFVGDLYEIVPLLIKKIKEESK